MAAGAVVLALVAWTGTTGTYAGFPDAALGNPTNTAASGALTLRADYQSTTCALVGSQATSTTCTGSIAPTTTAPAGVTSSITNLGSAPASRLTESVTAPSCAPAQLADAASAARPMLPRYNTGFRAADPWGGTSAITLSGGGDYASTVVSQAQPNPLISLGSTYGLGIWFKTSTTVGGPLFEIATNATATSGGDDRVLYMRANGTLAFVQNTSGATTSSSKAYNDGAWHFAYVTMSALNLVLGVTSSTTLYVDGVSAGTGGGLLVGYGADTGYWHLGWAPTTVTGLSSAYFTGSLSEFVVFDNAGAPAAPSTAQRASQAAFDTWAASATDRWPLGDSGTTTFAGPYPVIGATSPCTMLDLTWMFANPDGTAASGIRLSAFATGAAHTVTAPAPGVTQTMTISTARDPTYDAYVSGLHLYAPLSLTVGTSPASAWMLTFSWPGAAAEFIA